MPGGALSRHGELLRLAWPAVLSFVLNNAYRINDQFWIRDLGGAAQAAIASSTFVLIMNFAVLYLAAGGALPLVARACGGGDTLERDRVARHAIGAALLVGTSLAVAGWWSTPSIVDALGLSGEPAVHATAYLRTIYLGVAPLALAPTLDGLFTGQGNTFVPMVLQSLAVTTNFALNPLLIYGVGGFAGMGIAGAALATVLSRGLAVGIGLVLLARLYRIPIARLAPADPARLVRLFRVGFPVSLSIAAYAGVYWILLRVVLAPLGEAAMAGLGIGFNAFEGLSFPFFLGVAVAGSSLVGRRLGAGDERAAREVVSSARLVGRLFGIAFALLFWFGGPWLVPLFAGEEAVRREALTYVRILAFSQLFVAEETVHEKALHGAGFTGPIFTISTLGNALRIPLGWWLALRLEWGAAGVWWAINATTVLKAALFRLEFERGGWRGREPGR